MTPVDLATLKAENRQLKDYARKLEEEVARLQSILAERERGSEHQYRDTVPAQHLSTWKL